MPKKSDRPNHESTMSRLLPDVSLEEEESDLDNSNPDNRSSTELQNSRTTEEENYSSKEQAQIKNQSPSESRSPKRGAPESLEETASHEEMSSRRQRLQVTPNKRPDLANKLGPYVSEEVDQALEEVYLLLRREFGGKASKSLIVEAALRYSLSDCLRRENDSELSRWLDRVLEA